MLAPAFRSAWFRYWHDAHANSRPFLLFSSANPHAEHVWRHMQRQTWAGCRPACRGAARPTPSGSGVVWSDLCQTFDVPAGMLSGPHGEPGHVLYGQAFSTTWMLAAGRPCLAMRLAALAHLLEPGLRAWLCGRRRRATMYCFRPCGAPPRHVTEATTRPCGKSLGMCLGSAWHQKTCKTGFCGIDLTVFAT